MDDTQDLLGRASAIITQAQAAATIVVASAEVDSSVRLTRVNNRQHLVRIARGLLDEVTTEGGPAPLPPDQYIAARLAMRLLPDPDADGDSEDRPPAPLFHVHWRPIAGGAAEHTAGAFHLGSALDLVRALTRGSDGNTVYWLEPVPPTTEAAP